MRKSLALTVFLITLLALVGSSSAVSQLASMESITNPTYTDMSGNKKDVNEYKGKVLLLNFWASWCGPCIMEVPGLNKVHEQYKTKGFEILSLSLDSQFGLTRIKDVAQRSRMKYTIGKAHTEMLGELQINAIPMSLLFGKDGTLVRKYTGPPHAEILKKDIEAALAR
jgi:thiol-disulfide isomerase/thioredoxin